jgi:hypothetical protein
LQSPFHLIHLLVSFPGKEKTGGLPFKLPGKWHTDEGDSSTSPHPKAHRQTAERFCHGTCPGDKHSTTHDGLLMNDPVSEHPFAPPFG